jgi:L-2-hydroxycarboxylate dehydrogenase (NAD+)
MSTPPQPGYLLYPAPGLRQFTRSCFAAAGMPEADASLAARLLVRTEARGVESHGLRWVPVYCKALREGRINPRPAVSAAADLGAALLVDGDNGLGHVVSSRAMEWCIERASAHGVGLAAVRSSRHNGAASLYALQAAEAGMIGLSLTGGGVRVAPAGGREALLGTNPIAFAAPAGRQPPFVMDMATSVVAGAKVQAHAAKGLPIPLGWALDSEGRPTTDARAADVGGVLLPLGGALELGGHKGYALALMVETLCNVLSGMATGPERTRGGTGTHGSGHFLMALRIEGFQSPDEFRRRMDENLRILRSSPPVEGVDRLYTPGEIEWRKEQERERTGIPVYGGTVEALHAAAAELGVEGLESRPA